MWFSKKSQAVISVFLILILLPVWGLAVILVDGARFQSAKMMVQEAGDLAALSTLSKYNTNLKNDYGLFALSNPDKANEAFEAYLKSSLSASLGGNSEYSDQVYNAVKGAIFNEADGISNFTDLYRFTLGKTNVNTHFDLSQKEVLQNQIVEFTKYRGAYFLADRLSLLTSIGKGDVAKEVENMQKSGELMEKKLEIDEDGQKVEEEIKKLNNRISAFYTAIDKAQTDVNTASIEMSKTVNEMERAYDDYMMHTTDAEMYPPEYSVIDTERVRDCLSDLSSACITADKSTKEAFNKLKEIDNGKISNLRSMIQSEINELRNFQNGEVKNSSASVATEMSNDIDTTVKKYESYLKKLEKLEKYFRDTYDEDATNMEIASTMCKNIYTALDNTRISEINSPNLLAGNENEDTDSTIGEIQYFGMKTSGKKYVSDGQYLCDEDQARETYYSETKDGRKSAKAGCIYYINQCHDIKKRIELFQITEEPENTEEIKVAQDKASDANKEVKSGKKSISDAEYSILPSKGIMDISNPASTYQTNPDKMTESTHDILGSLDLFSQIGEATRDEALTLAYLFGMFKTKLSNSTDFCKGTKPTTMKNYHVPWRYEHEDGEHNLKELPKSGYDTVLDYEVEYVFGGKKSDSANYAIIYAWIYSTRSANNLIAAYSNSSIRNQCLAWGTATAAAVSAATLGFVTLSPTVYQWVFLTAWALAETTLEMDYLVNKGYKVSLIKTGQNMLIDSLDDFTHAESNLNSSVTKGISVCYEDYLLLMLLCVGSETRVRRIGDLVQLNMRHRYKDGFLLKNAPTYIEATTDVSMPYLFQSINQFSDFYKGYGTGINVKSTIFQGY